ncbi:hypothetical protein HDU78_005784 [Chytriomyces hyalinus]|nr:hypothetical protein HDU78_005784 [Chytriomyces hyalinus]
MQCPVCKLQQVKYKCSACREPYCSVPCYKTHKASQCHPTAKPQEPSKEAPKPPQDSTNSATDPELQLRNDQLEKLVHNDNIRNLLRTNPDLASFLHNVNTSADPEELIDRYLNSEGTTAFKEFAAEALQTVVGEEL